MNNKKTGVFKLTLFFYYTHNILGIQIKISLKRHGDAKTHFFKRNIVRSIKNGSYNFIFDTSNFTCCQMLESHVIKLDLCNVIGIDIQVFISIKRAIQVSIQL